MHIRYIISRVIISIILHNSLYAPAYSRPLSFHNHTLYAPAYARSHAHQHHALITSIFVDLVLVWHNELLSICQPWTTITTMFIGPHITIRLGLIFLIDPLYHDTIHVSPEASLSDWITIWLLSVYTATLRHLLTSSHTRHIDLCLRRDASLSFGLRHTTIRKTTRLYYTTPNLMIAPAHSSVLLRSRTHYMSYMIMTSHWSLPPPPHPPPTRTDPPPPLLLILRIKIHVTCGSLLIILSRLLVNS